MPRRLLLLPLPLLLAQSAAPPFTVEETGKAYWRLQDAVSAIGGGDGTIAIRAGTYRDCAIQEAGRVAFKAASAVKPVFDGGQCEDKATLVLRGREAAVRGIEFRNIRVPDMNGAGIRLEHGSLTVSDSIFRNSEQGILTADDPTATLRIEGSTFSGLGTCEGGGGCAHSIYIGALRQLIVTRSRFERGRGGHYVKSRAPLIEVTDTSFDDSAGKATNYMIDLSAGAVGAIRGNMFVQGTDKENHSAFIAVAAESRDNRSAGLVVTGNRASIAPGAAWGSSVFVADWSHEPLAVSANTLGRGLKSTEVRN